MGRARLPVLVLGLGLLWTPVYRDEARVEAIPLKTRQAFGKHISLVPSAPTDHDTQSTAAPRKAGGLRRPQVGIGPAAVKRSFFDRGVANSDGGAHPGKAASESGSQRKELAGGFPEVKSEVYSGWNNILEWRLTEEISPHQATQAVLLVDGGSSKTQPVLFKMQTVGRPGKHRAVLEDTISFVGEGTKREGVRVVLESFLDGAAGPGWESRSLESDTLVKHFPTLELKVARFVGVILKEAAATLEQTLTEEERSTAKTLGVPVLFNSTAGIRDFAPWCAGGFFVAVRRAVNKYETVLGYRFYTDPDLTRPLSGEEEGVSAFLTANLLLGNLKRLQLDAAGGVMDRAHEKLAAIVEVGGASMQIVVPVRATLLPPASVHLVRTPQDGYLSAQYPPVHLSAISYMQLGANSASGVFLKGFCSDAAHLRDGVCHNPCLHKHFEQECSAGPVTITAEGEVQVNTDLKKNRLKPLATYCGEANEDFARRHTTRLTCLAARISPGGSSLAERVSIPGCTRIRGTGDFKACLKSVDTILLDSAFALPANAEAEGTGFDTPGQFFSTVSTSAPMLVTGAAVVFPLQNLKKLGLLSSSFAGDVGELENAATAFCTAPMDREGRYLTLTVNNRKHTLTSFSYEDCLRLAFTLGLLLRVNSGKERPASVNFSTKIADPVSGKVLGSAGWPLGRIFKEVQDEGSWSTRAYENGPAYSFGFSKR